MVCLGKMCMDTLRKEEEDDDDDNNNNNNNNNSYRVQENITLEQAMKRSRGIVLIFL